MICLSSCCAQAACGANGNGAPHEIGSLISIEKSEEAHLRKVLSRTTNLAEAADVLGIDQATLYASARKSGWNEVFGKSSLASQQELDSQPLATPAGLA